MTTEEKAQRYDEISKEVKDFFDGKLMMYSDVKQTLNYLFPELGESEDEKIRKELIDYINRLTVTPNNIDRYNSWIAWLEKQGDSNNQNWKPSKGQIDALEHFVRSIAESGYASPYDDNTKLLKSLINDLYKLIENHSEQEEPQVYDTGDGDVITYSETEGYNVEPKLKIERGKWYVCIKNLLDDYGNIAFCKGDVYLSEKDEYLIPSNSNVPWMLTYCVDTYFKEWTIKDAKDGDVLAFKNNIGGIIICKSPTNYNTRSYCRLVNEHLIKREESGWDSTLLVPTTKEQLDLLFAKMKEDGYEWDAEKKELKKIEQPKLTVIKDMMDDYRDDIDKHAWSVEDSSKVQRICKYLDEAKKYYADITEVRECIEWLKSIEDRVQPKPTDWSDEDEENLQNCCGPIGAADYYTYDDKQDMEKWLESLKDRVQPQQKPTWSDEDERLFKATTNTVLISRNSCEEDDDVKDLFDDELRWLKSLKERLS